MMIAFLVPVPDLRTGYAVATYGQRIIVAKTPDELRKVPPAWKPVDLQKMGTVSVTDWIEDQA